jgi:transcription elongation factor SPT4
VYAIKVSGQLPDEIRTTLEDEYRIQYIPYEAPAKQDEREDRTSTNRDL